MSRMVLRSLLASSLLITAASALNPKSNSNVAVYWGQGPSQKRLADYCAESPFDIAILSFVNIYPDQAPGGVPGTNFGNACEGILYTTPAGVQTSFLTSCPLVGPDIIKCQKKYKIKILLSIGGAFPGDGVLKSNASATAFADFLWGAFGPITAAWTAASMPRPFGKAVVDGFDLDVESAAVVGTTLASQGWSTFNNHLKNDLYPTDRSKRYFISGAPQCVLPDANLSDAIANSWFDFILVQFYNTPYCSARAGVDRLQGNQQYGYDISLDAWFAAPSFNPKSKIYVGLPAAYDAAGSSTFYLDPDELSLLVSAYRPKYPHRFGGVMLWDATRSELQPVNGKPYVDSVKSVLLAASGAIPRPTGAVSATSVKSSTTSKAATSTTTNRITSTITTSSSTSSKKTTKKVTTTSTSQESTPSSSTCATGSYSCSGGAGSLICIDTTHYGICNNGCAVSQPVAPGTICSNGAIGFPQLKRSVDSAGPIAQMMDVGDDEVEVNFLGPPGSLLHDVELLSLQQSHKEEIRDVRKRDLAAGSAAGHSRNHHHRHTHQKNRRNNGSGN